MDLQTFAYARPRLLFFSGQGLAAGGHSSGSLRLWLSLALKPILQQLDHGQTPARALQNCDSRRFQNQGPETLAHSSQFTPPCESHVFVGDGIRESKIAVFAEAPPLLAPPRSVPYAPETRWF